MGRPKVIISDEQREYLTELAIENSGKFSADIFHAFNAKFVTFKIANSTLQRRFEEIWSNIELGVQINTSNC